MSRALKVIPIFSLFAYLNLSCPVYKSQMVIFLSQELLKRKKILIHVVFHRHVLLAAVLYVGCISGQGRGSNK